ncbi:MAG: RNA polymerase sigma factor [Polyangiaceae bacterium]|nr:RNA polymerase sigma factor [Polyangiaceae bacterium]
MSPPQASFAAQLLAELPTLLRVARRLTRSESDAEDLVQATVERAIQRRDDLRESEKLRAWLLQIQRSVLFNQVRGMRNRLEVIQGGRGADTPIEPSADMEAEILGRSFDDELQRGLEDLPSDWRDALLLREVEELSYEEIAKIQGCPVGTVRSRLARARAALIERLSKQSEESWQGAAKSGLRASRRGTTAR